MSLPIVQVVPAYVRSSAPLFEDISGVAHSATGSPTPDSIISTNRSAHNIVSSSQRETCLHISSGILNMALPVSQVLHAVWRKAKLPWANPGVRFFHFECSFEALSVGSERALGALGHLSTNEASVNTQRATFWIDYLPGIPPFHGSCISKNQSLDHDRAQTSCRNLMGVAMLNDAGWRFAVS